jgi:glycosyltransferase involved in cell wall biosynthesis
LEKVVKLSAAVICFNEEDKIATCLNSLSEVVDEIIVVDSFSTDKTKSICLSHNVTFIENKFIGHIEQKNFALSQCNGEYVLSLDADEVLSDELISSIKKEKENFSHAGYRFHRLTGYAGKWIRHSGWYPDTKLRLVKNSSAKWNGVNPHDILQLDNGEKGKLISGDLLHYSYDSITDHIDQTNKFTTIAAKQAFSANIKSSQFKIVTRPCLKFLKDYFLKRGFLDGRYGFVVCYINALSAFLKYSKIKELQEGKEI